MRPTRRGCEHSAKAVIISRTHPIDASARLGHGGCEFATFEDFDDRCRHRRTLQPGVSSLYGTDSPPVLGGYDSQPSPLPSRSRP